MTTLDCNVRGRTLRFLDRIFSQTTLLSVYQVTVELAENRYVFQAIRVVALVLQRMLPGTSSPRFSRGLHAGMAMSLLLSALACAPESSRMPVSGSTRLAYQQRCALCHGDVGDGRGGQAAMLPAKVPDWSDSSWQSQASDDSIRTVIVGGGAAAGKSVAMPANPDLAGKPMLDEMVMLIRSFGR